MICGAENLSRIKLFTEDREPCTSYKEIRSTNIEILNNLKIQITKI